MNYTLYISYDGMTDPLGQSQVIPYLKALSKAGYKIILISFEKKSNHQDISAIQELFAQNNIIWEPLKYHKKPVIPATLIDVVTGVYYTIYFCKKYKVKLIHCRSYIAALIAFLSKPFCTFKMVFDMRGFWADERIEGNIWNKSKFIHRLVYSFFKKMEKRFLTQADQVITLTQAAKNYIHQNFKLKTEIVVIPCSTDLQLFHTNATPITNDEEISEAKRKNKFILIYVGSLGSWYMTKEMLQFFKLLSESIPSVFLIVTPDPKELILKEAQAAGVNFHDLIIRKSKRKEMPSWLATADAGIFFIRPVFSKTASSPVKHGEMMACGLPVITNAGIGDLDEIIIRTNTGVILKDWHHESMKNVATRLLSIVNEKKLSDYSKAAEEYYSLNSASAKYISIYRNLLGK